MYLVECRFRIFAYGRRITRKITLTKSVGDSESRITEDLEFDSILFFWAGSRMVTLIPRYSGLFDSFDVAPLPDPSTPWPVCPSGGSLPSRGYVWLHLLKDFCSNVHLTVAAHVGRRKLKKIQKLWNAPEMPTQEEIEESLNQDIDDFFAH